MKSTFFEKNIEYQIEVDGESWNQGDIINGELRVRNMSNETLTLETTQLVLAHGLKKAIKEKNESVWELQEKLVLAEDISLPPNKIETSLIIFEESNLLTRSLVTPRTIDSLLFFEEIIRDTQFCLYLFF